MSDRDSHILIPRDLLEDYLREIVRMLGSTARVVSPEPPQVAVPECEFSLSRGGRDYVICVGHATMSDIIAELHHESRTSRGGGGSWKSRASDSVGGLVSEAELLIERMPTESRFVL